MSHRINRTCRGVVGYLGGLVMTLMLGTLQAYKLLISPLLGSRCRFHPSCSAYAQQSLSRFGPFKGGLLTLTRLARCGPWHAGGIDEVPASFAFFGRVPETLDKTDAAHSDCAQHDSFSPSRS